MRSSAEVEECIEEAIIKGELDYAWAVMGEEGLLLSNRRRNNLVQKLRFARIARVEAIA